METVLIVIHLMIVVALVAVVLLQRSEGGGLGIGGGGGGLMTARGAADTLTRTTSILGAAFFITSIALGLIGRYAESPTDVLDRLPSITQPAGENGDAGGNGVLDALGGSAEQPASPGDGTNAAVPNDAGTSTPSTGADAPAAETPSAPAPAIPNN